MNNHPLFQWDKRLSTPLFTTIGIVLLCLILIPIEMFRFNFIIHGLNDYSRILTDFQFLNGQFHGSQDTIILSENFNKTLFYSLTLWLFNVVNETQASYIGFSLFYFMYLSGFLWILRREMQSLMGLITLLALIGSPQLFHVYSLFPSYLSHHLVAYAFLAWSWYLFLGKRYVWSGVLYSIALGVHVSSALPSGFCFLILLLAGDLDWSQRLRRLSRFTLAAIPITLFFLARMAGGGEPVNLWKSSEEVMRLIHYRAPFFLADNWSMDVWLHLLLWLILVPITLFLLRNHLGERLKPVALTIGVVALPYVTVTQGLLELTHMPFFVILTGKGMEVLIVLQFLFLIKAIHHYSQEKNSPGLGLLLGLGFIMTLNVGSLLGFVFFLMLFILSKTYLPSTHLNRMGGSWLLASALVVMVWGVSFLYPWMQKHPNTPLPQLFRLMYWKGLDSPRIEPLLFGKTWLPEKWHMPRHPPERLDVAEFLKRQDNPRDMIAFSWRDNWWMMGLRPMTHRGVFVDWDSGGDGTRAASQTWLKEWYLRYGANRIFFSFPHNGQYSPEYQQWTYEGPSQIRVTKTRERYLKLADDETFEKSAKILYDTQVRWIAHMGPFPRSTKLLEPVFTGRDLFVYRLHDPGPLKGMEEFKKRASQVLLPFEKPHSNQP